MFQVFYTISQVETKKKFEQPWDVFISFSFHHWEMWALSMFNNPINASLSAVEASSLSTTSYNCWKYCKQYKIITFRICPKTTVPMGE